MAHKGDFPECAKCTSFQCRTCGLDHGSLRPEGNITFSETLININILLICGSILEYCFGSDFSFFLILWIIGVVFATLMLFVYISMKQEDYNASDNLFYMAMVVEYTPLILLIYSLFLQ